MTLANWAAAAEIVSSAGIFASLVSLNFQFRESKKRDEREAAFELLRSFQTVEFTKILMAINDLPPGLSKKEMDERFGDDVPLLSAFFGTWESLGIMVHRGQVDLDLVCDFFSGPILQAWAVAERYAEDMRQDFARETLLEWFQWLAERVKACELRESPIPAYIEHKNSQ